MLGKRPAAVLAAGTLALTLAACGGASGSGASSGSGPLTVAMVTAFTGQNAYFGAGAQVACEVAAMVIARGGSVLGHPLACKYVDDRDDPADAVPAVNQLLATTGNLMLVGSISDETPTVLPLLRAAQIPAFSLDGDPRLAQNTDPFFFRLISSDATAGSALGYYAASHGYTHAAAVFTSDSGAQSAAASVTAAYKHAGGSLVAQLTLQPGSVDYRTEAAAVVKAHPDALLTEMDASTAESFLQEVAQLSGGRIPPLIGPVKLEQGDFMKTVARAVGSSVVAGYRTVVQATPAPNAAYADFWHTVLSFGSKIQDPSQYQADPYTQSLYDAIIASALAMIEAHSTAPAQWAPLIPALFNGVPGAVPVSTFAAGKAALAAGKKIQYVGVIGHITLNQYHNTITPFTIQRLTPGTFQPVTIGQISSSELASAS